MNNLFQRQIGCTTKYPVTKTHEQKITNDEFSCLSFSDLKFCKLMVLMSPSQCFCLSRCYFSLLFWFNFMHGSIYDIYIYIILYIIYLNYQLDNQVFSLR